MRSDAPGSSLVLHAGSDDGLVGDAVESLGTDEATVRAVDSEAAALTAVREESVGCLVCESEFADGDGLELLSALETSAPLLPTLFLTDDPSLGDAALSAGATDIVVKQDGLDPVAVLARRLENTLSRGPAVTRDADEEAVALLQSMYDVTTDTESSFEAKVDRLLRLGCETFSLSNGFLTRIEGGEADGKQTIVQSRGPHEKLSPGESCPLSRAYCRETVRTDGLLAFEDAVEAGWTDDPSYEEFGLGCYIGGKVVVDGELYGTLCFADTEPRQTPFTELERTAVRLMSEWVSYELEGQQARAELELKERAMDEAPVGILISDPDQHDNPAVYVNDQFTEMTGYPEADALGRNCRFLQGERTDPEPVAELRAAIDAERPVSVELRNYRRDGTEFWNRVSVAPIRNSEGEVTNYVGFQEDVTERKEHELELKLRNRAISAAPIGITIHDTSAPALPVTYANSGFEAITGYEPTAIEGEPLSMLAGAETEPERAGALETVGGESASETLLLYRTDGSPFWGRVSIAPVTDEDGETTHAVGFLQDVTETKQHAEEIERRLDEFGDVLAAELQTPLRDARSRLAADLDELSPGDLSAALAAIERTDSLIDDLTTVHSFSVKSRDVFETDGSAPGTDP
ncbi:PAS domain-containing protein [Haloarcula salinisoli]|uniref:PAS domain-containing protein n=1 Tax=Haloarcula salinisoli TaxID=2487746 RepID=A0A8J7YHT0_9EURY|nr:PAS domain-containing protein [Halomicroarcula salinisoli]MBX0284936.1 PAS domain-containing protein [Halomicroarcula salinisoli]MBX0303586.1 PAS domain-containing protein [Halomicroarcula salinisoli]